MKASDDPGREHSLRALADELRDPLGLLADVSQAFATSLDLDETLDNTVAQISHYMHAEAASLFLLENDDTELVCKASAGPVDVVGLRLKADQGIVGKSVTSGRVQFIRDVREDADFAEFVDATTGFETRSVLCAPLVLRGHCLGAMEVLNKGEGDGLFDASDRHLLQVLASSAALVIRNARMAVELVEQERIRKELELAREIQATLLPGQGNPADPIVGVNIPAREVSGDFYDYYRLGDGRMAFSLGDVSGKGMNAALLMAKTSSLLHCLGKGITRPSELLAQVNREVCESVTRGMFVTLVAGIYDPAHDEVCLANAGHQPPMLLDVAGGMTELPATAPPLGILADVEFPEQRVRLEGRRLYLFTDGVTEAPGPAGGDLGVDGLRAELTSRGALPARERLERVVAELAAREALRRDDITLLVIESPGTEPHRYTFEARAGNLEGLRGYVDGVLRTMTCPDRLRDQLVLAVNEACMNIIQHGYGGDTRDAITLQILNNDGILEFRVEDAAPRVDPARIKPRELTDIRPGGLGTHFIREIMDEVDYQVPEHGRGNRLVMRKRISNHEVAHDAV